MKRKRGANEEGASSPRPTLNDEPIGEEEIVGAPTNSCEAALSLFLSTHNGDSQRGFLSGVGGAASGGTSCVYLKESSLFQCDLISRPASLFGPCENCGGMYHWGCVCMNHGGDTTEMSEEVDDLMKEKTFCSQSCVSAWKEKERSGTAAKGGETGGGADDAR